MKSQHPDQHYSEELNRGLKESHRRTWDDAMRCVEHKEDRQWCVSPSDLEDEAREKAKTGEVIDDRNPN